MTIETTLSSILLIAFLDIAIIAVLWNMAYRHGYTSAKTEETEADKLHQLIETIKLKRQLDELVNNRHTTLPTKNKEQTK